MLDAAWNLMKERGAADVTLAEVARQAGLSRQAVYLFFGSRAGLLNAMTRYHDRKRGIARRFVLAMRSEPSSAAIGEVVKVWFGYLPDIAPVAFAFQAAAATDRDATAAWRDRMDAVRSAFLGVAQRLADDDRLRPGWTIATAADFMWAGAHISVWRALVVDRGWTETEAAEKVAAALSDAIVARER